ncbi:hypothetical protein C7M84_007548 [Penaeus vannamei]|uniref:Protein kinase domain-containing protein n=1 Tax=Penaeus vannamei TaxID=6689 RepID=A0A3R7N0G1_PENVA|nr:hypothetical protein C7M84_007548 [Penaeus vannamei]
MNNLCSEDRNLHTTNKMALEELGSHEIWLPERDSFARIFQTYFGCFAWPVHGPAHEQVALCLRSGVCSLIAPGRRKRRASAEEGKTALGEEATSRQKERASLRRRPSTRGSDVRRGGIFCETLFGGVRGVSEPRGLGEAEVSVTKALGEDFDFPIFSVEEFDSCKGVVTPRLGKGGHGTAFLNLQKQTGDETCADAGEAKARALLAKCRGFQRLVGVCPESTCPVTEYAGKSLTANVVDRLQRMSVVRQVCSILQRLHKHGLVHNDLKPDNLCLRMGKRTPGDRDRPRPGGGCRGPPLLKTCGGERGVPCGRLSDAYAVGKLLLHLCSEEEQIRGRCSSGSQEPEGSRERGPGLADEGARAAGGRLLRRCEKQSHSAHPRSARAGVKPAIAGACLLPSRTERQLALSLSCRAPPTCSPPLPPPPLNPALTADFMDAASTPPIVLIWDGGKEQGRPAPKSLPRADFGGGLQRRNPLA